MKPINTRPWSTPLIIGSSAVVAISGIMMFFHLGEGLVKSMHEWLGLLFIAAILLHILNHSSSLVRYFSQRRALWVMAAVLTLATSWIINTGTTQEHPAKRLFATVQQAPLSVVADLQQQKHDEMIARLRAAGIQVDSAQQSLADLATLNKRRPLELLDIIMSANQPKS